MIGLVADVVPPVTSALRRLALSWLERPLASSLSSSAWT